MIDDKTKNCIIENFEIAAKEFNFNFVTPYYAGKNHELCFFGYFRRYIVIRHNYSKISHYHLNQNRSKVRFFPKHF